jgi:hypothetical protein
MLRVVLGAGCGLLFGALFGGGAALLIHLAEQGGGFETGPIQRFNWFWPSAPLPTMLFSYGFLGGGFGAVVGAIAGGTRAILLAMRATPPSDPPPPPR